MKEGHGANGKRKRPTSKQAGKSALRRKALKLEKDKLLDVETRHQLSQEIKDNNERSY